MEESPSIQFKLNIPMALKDRLSEAAIKSGRSLSSEIITRLQTSITMADDQGLEFTRESIEELIADMIGREVEPIRDRIRAIMKDIEDVAMDTSGR